MSPDDRTSDSAARAIERLTRRLERLELRIAALEAQPAAVAAASSPPEIDSAEARLPAAGSLELLPLIGRTLLVLAGAFVLRAITETGALPQVAGAVIGLAYSLIWFVLADRAVRRDQRTSAVFHGLAGSIIAMPLLVEATARFEVFSAPLAALIVAALLALGLGIPAHRGLHPMAWIVGLGGAATLLALAASTRSWILFGTLLLALGLAGLWLGYLRAWRSLGWTLAATIDLTMLILAVVALRASPDKIVALFDPAALVALQLAVVVGYFGMNFDNLPGLDHRWGWITATTVMLVIAVVSLGMFVSLGWMDRPSGRRSGRMIGRGLVEATRTPFHILGAVVEMSTIGLRSNETTPSSDPGDEEPTGSRNHPDHGSE